MKDFRKFATSKMGINGMVLDDIVSMQNQYMNPYILEERQSAVTTPLPCGGVRGRVFFVFE